MAPVKVVILAGVALLHAHLVASSPSDEAWLEGGELLLSLPALGLTLRSSNDEAGGGDRRASA